jgi:glycosyltransferase involved in cell wall biosynthesis
MRIGMDLSALFRPGTGAERVVCPLAQHLMEALEPGEHLRGFANGRGALASDAAGIAIVNPRWPWRLLSLAWRRGWWPLERFTGAIDAFLANDWLCPPRLRHGALIVTVFDMAFARAPALVPPDTRRHMHGQLRSWVSRASGLIAISESTRRDLLTVLGPRCPEVRVIYPGVDPELETAPEDLETLRKRLSLPEDYILHLGTHVARKNLPRLLSAYARARRAGVGIPLVLLGGAQTPGRRIATRNGGSDPVRDDIRRLGLLDCVIVLGHRPRADVVAILKGARFLTFPSLYEGFGFPVLEAMACGVPVLTSRATSLPEVCGDAALYSDPSSEEDIAQAIVEMHRNRSLRAELGARGRARARPFTWDRAARLTLDFVRDLSRAHSA